MIDKPKTYTATVSSVVNVAGKFYVAKLRLVEPKEIQFLAGQYVICKIGPPKGNHTLSIASAPASPASPRLGGPTNRGEPNPDGTIELLQSVAPMGEGSKWLLGLKPGQTVQFLGPLGKFILQKQSPRPKVFVATGCGIAPLRSMIMDELTRQGTESNKQMTLYWGLRHEEDVFWKEEFEALAAEHPNFHSTITLSQPASPASPRLGGPTNRGEPTGRWIGVKGRVTEHVVTETPELGSSEFYLCGTRQMIVDMRQLLADNGVPPKQIFTETFF